MELAQNPLPLINMSEQLFGITSSFYHDLKCVICHDLLDNPLECSKCSRYFCKKCLISWREANQASEIICPLKCERVQFLQPNSVMRKYIYAFKELECSLAKPNNANSQDEENNEEIVPKKVPLDGIFEQMTQHISQCDKLPVNCKDCKEMISKKDFKDHYQICQNSSKKLIKCEHCGKEYFKQLEISHFKKHCEKAIECSKCKLKISPSERNQHECVSYLLQFQQENKRQKKMLRKQNEKLEQLVKNTQKKYKDLIRNEGNFCSFCEQPISSDEQAGIFCRLCNKMSCKCCKYDNLFYCQECKHNYCNKCSHSKKVLICDMHWNI